TVRKAQILSAGGERARRGGVLVMHPSGTRPGARRSGWAGGGAVAILAAAFSTPLSGAPDAPIQKVGRPPSVLASLRSSRARSLGGHSLARKRLSRRPRSRAGVRALDVPRAGCRRA